MLNLDIAGDTIIPRRESGEVADEPLGFINWRGGFVTNTAKSYLTVVGYIEDVCELYGIEDFESRLMHQTGLEISELSKINKALNFQTDGLRRCLEAKRSGANYKFLLEKLHTSDKRPVTGVIARRGTVVRKYFQYLMQSGDRHLRHYVVHPNNLIEQRKFYEARNEAYRDITDQIDVPKVSRKAIGSKASLYALTKLENFMETYDPLTIWKSSDVAVRNYVVFGLQFYCGLRIGEVLSLKIEDIKNDRDTKYLRLVDRRDLNDDPRKARPALKTLERDVPIRERLAERLGEWLDYRAEIIDELFDNGHKDRARGRYLFVSLDRRQNSFGQPLSSHTVYLAFKDILKASELKANGGSHELRHLAAMRFVREARKPRPNGDVIPNALITETLRQLFGWSPKSDMPSYYTSHEITQQMNEIFKQDDEAYAARMKKISDEEEG